VFSFGLGVVYAEDEAKMPWENLPKGAVSTKEKHKIKNKDTGKKVAKIDKGKNMGKEKNKKAAETTKKT
jgi:hypothetical protein